MMRRGLIMWFIVLLRGVLRVEVMARVMVERGIGCRIIYVQLTSLLLDLHEAAIMETGNKLNFTLDIA